MTTKRDICYCRKYPAVCPAWKRIRAQAVIAAYRDGKTLRFIRTMWGFSGDTQIYNLMDRYNASNSD